MGSTTMAATSLALTVVLNRTSSIYAAFPNGACVTPGTRGPNPFRWTGFDDVSDNAPIVRPWNADWNAMNCHLPVAYRASFIAASIASAPEFPKKQRQELPPGI